MDYSVASTDSTQLYVFIKRLRQRQQSITGRQNDDKKNKALWFLTGTPTSTDFESLIKNGGKSLEQFDVYGMDHRGTGNSHRLGCPSNQAESTGSEGGVAITDNEMHQCSQSLSQVLSNRLDLFSSSYASLDLASVLEALKDEYESTHVTGVGYGTYWLSRFLQIIPEHDDLIQSAIMDSVISTTSGDDKDPDANGQRTVLTNWDKDVNSVGLNLLQNYCNNQTVCYEKLKRAPVKFLTSTFESVFQNQTCSRLTQTSSKKKKDEEKAVTENELRRFLGSLVLRPSTRDMIPAMLYRLHRCDPDVDVPTLQHAFQFFRSKESQSTVNNAPISVDGSYSKVWESLVTFSELFPRDLSLASPSVVEAVYNTTFMGTGESVSKAKTLLVSQFPIYEPDVFFNKAPQPKIPVLMLNGDLDAKTPIQYARHQATAMGAPTNVRLVELPSAAHNTLLYSHQRNSSVTCGMEIMLSFLNNGAELATVDTSCLARIITPNFTGSAEMDKLFFGVADIYEDAYEAPEIEKTVNLYLFIGVEAGTVVASIIIICCLIYYIVQLKDKSSDYEEIEE